MNQATDDEETTTDAGGKFGLSWTPRTYLRLFLVLAGGVLFLRGAQTGSEVDLLLGALAAGVGLITLYRERSA